MRIIKTLEDLISVKWWYFYIGVLTATDIQLLCGIYILPKLLRALEAEGVI